jgi:hypothetical protein
MFSDISDQELSNCEMLKSFDRHLTTAPSANLPTVMRSLSMTPHALSPTPTDWLLVRNYELPDTIGQPTSKVHHPIPML